MARKRMFDMEIVDTDLFLDMPQSSQNLYFHLGMRADDDGFVSNPKKIIKAIGANEDDLKLLFLKKFVIPFESGVCVITHWKLNNYLRKDRYTETIYKNEKRQLTEDENGVYSLDTSINTSVGIPTGIPDDNQCVTSGIPYGIPSIEKNRIDKNSIEYNRKDKRKEIVEIYNTFCTNLPQVQKITDKRNKAIDKFLKEFTAEQFKELCKIANESDFLIGNNERNWKADFDFIMRIDKATAILEGKYTQKTKTVSSTNIDRWLEQKEREEAEENAKQGI